jgi:hypothetical protein
MLPPSTHLFSHWSTPLKKAFCETLNMTKLKKLRLFAVVELAPLPSLCQLTEANHLPATHREEILRVREGN